MPTPVPTAVPVRTWIAIVASTIGAFMAVLNIQIVSASLADIQGAIGASADDGGWISTSYLVAEIIVIPLTAWFARVFSTRLYLIGTAVLFLLFSAACSLAQTLEQMIVLRALQGFAGGALIPLAFTLIITLLPQARQPIGLALFAIAATFAPAIGPTIGGYLTDNWGWEYVFYLNLVPGLPMVALLAYALDRAPMQLGLLRQGDWWGIATMAIGLGALQTALEEGNKDDWLGSPFIVKLLVVAAIALPAFVWIELTTANPLVNLRLLARRNFGFGIVATFLVGIALYGSALILPAYLARLQGYNAQQIGTVLAWTGLPQLLVIPLVPMLMQRFDARYLVALGFGLFALSNFMNVAISADSAGDQLLLPNIVRAIGQALAMTPLAALAAAGIEAEHSGSASALLNGVRNLGGAIGIAVLNTFLTQREQFHAQTIGETVSIFDEATRARLDQLTHSYLTHEVGDPALAWHRAVAAIGKRVHQEAFTMAFSDAFLLLGVLLVVALAVCLLLKRPARLAGSGVH